MRQVHGNRRVARHPVAQGQHDLLRLRQGKGHALTRQRSTAVVEMETGEQVRAKPHLNSHGDVGAVRNRLHHKLAAADEGIAQRRRPLGQGAGVEADKDQAIVMGARLNPHRQGVRLAVPVRVERHVPESPRLRLADLFQRRIDHAGRVLPILARRQARVSAKGVAERGSALVSGVQLRLDHRPAAQQTGNASLDLQPGDVLREGDPHARREPSAEGRGVDGPCVGQVHASLPLLKPRADSGSDNLDLGRRFRRRRFRSVTGHGSPPRPRPKATARRTSHAILEI